MVQEFRPRGRATPDRREDVARLFRAGGLIAAMSRCRRNGWDVESFRSEFELGAKRLVVSRRHGELLSFLYKHGLTCQYEPIVLLRWMFEAGDYPGVLKQAHRFAIVDGFESELERAIAWHEERGLVNQAVAWRRKFAELRASK
ncbi:MAG: hypothetical protein HY690_01755 [Chloroflexi bacterium]|nr:hypothetical protein [Chloroflexota bacterium]